MFHWVEWLYEHNIGIYRQTHKLCYSGNYHCSIENQIDTDNTHRRVTLESKQR